MNVIFQDKDGGYTHVADVNTNCLERAWFLTNNVDHSWYTNTEVTLTDLGKRQRRNNCIFARNMDTGLRSAMEGDIYVTDDGIAHEVASVSFKPLGFWGGN